MVGAGDDMQGSGVKYTLCCPHLMSQLHIVIVNRYVSKIPVTGMGRSA